MLSFDITDKIIRIVRGFETSVYSRTIIPDDVRNARTSRAESSLEMRRML